MFWGLVPLNSTISWEAHLFSAVVGINLAFNLKKEIQQYLSLKENSENSTSPELPEEVWNYPKNYYHHQGLEE